MRRGALALLLVALATGCGGSSKHGAATTEQTATASAAAAQAPSAHGCARVKAPPARHNGGHAAPKKPLPSGKTYAAVVTTNCGSFTIALDAKQSPHAVASFVALARDGYFDRTIFHRIVPGFVIQGGDPSQTGAGGPGYTTVDTPPAGASYVRGVVAMAKTQTEPAGAAGSQFFVVTGADAALPPDYAIIGKVSAGLPVVLRIGRLGSVATEAPTRVVEIESVRISER